MQLRLITELVLVTVIVLLIGSIAYNAGTQDIFIRKSFADDAALVLSAMQSVPGNVYVQLPQDTNEYKVLLEQNKITVEDLVPSVTYFPGQVKTAEVSNSPVYFYKNGNEISIAPKIPTLTARSCTPVTLQRNNLKLRVTDETRSLALTLGFTCAQDICAADESSLRSAELLLKASTGKDLVAEFELSRRTIACSILNGMTARDDYFQSWLIPTASGVHIQVPQTRVQDLNNVVREVS